jgi:hypothetical protein
VSHEGHAGFVIPAQLVKAPKPPVGADWVHEIKHDGYRIIVRRDGPSVRLYSRNANDRSVRLAAIADAAELIKAKSFTIDGEAVVVAGSVADSSGKNFCVGEYRAGVHLRRLPHNSQHYPGDPS